MPVVTQPRVLPVASQDSHRLDGSQDDLSAVFCLLQLSEKFALSLDRLDF